MELYNYEYFVLMLQAKTTSVKYLNNFTTYTSAATTHFDNRCEHAFLSLWYFLGIFPLTALGSDDSRASLARNYMQHLSCIDHQTDNSSSIT